MVLLASAPSAPPAGPFPSPRDRNQLLDYAQATWRSFELLVQPGGLPADGVLQADGAACEPTAFTSPPSNTVGAKTSQS